MGKQIATVMGWQLQNEHEHEFGQEQEHEFGQEYEFEFESVLSAAKNCHPPSAAASIICR